MEANRFSGQARREARCLSIGRASQRTRGADSPHRRPGSFAPWRRCVSLPMPHIAMRYAPSHGAKSSRSNGSIRPDSALEVTDSSFRCHRRANPGGSSRPSVWKVPPPSHPSKGAGDRSTAASRAKSRLIRAIRAFPTCRSPVGEGAKLVSTVMACRKTRW